MTDENTKFVLRAFCKFQIAFTKELLMARAEINDLRTLIVEIASQSGIDAKAIDEKLRKLQQRRNQYVKDEFPPPDFEPPKEGAQE